MNTRYSMWPVLIGLLVISAACVSAEEGSGKYDGWLDASEASPFFPDDAFLVQPSGDPRTEGTAYRHSFVLTEAPAKAVLAFRGSGIAAAVLNGALVGEVRTGPGDLIPGFVEVTEHLRLGSNDIELRQASNPNWTSTVYAQLRIEYAGGRFEDIVTDKSWQWRQSPDEGWPRGPLPSGGWQPVQIYNDYYGSHGETWLFTKLFALMPRAMLQERMKKFNDALEASWPKDRTAAKPAFTGEYTKAEYGRQYEDFLRIDPESGQVIDASDRIRHLFFTIYGQMLEGTNTLSVWTFDFDRLEEDLSLMEESAVHVFLRMTGWQNLLDAEGNWQPCQKQPKGSNLPEFKYNYEVLDYFLDRCQAHGRFVAIETDFFWGAPWDLVPPPYHTRYYLYPEVAQANALAHRKMLVRYAQRPAVAMYLIGDEDVQMDYDLENSHLRARFIDYLRERYGTLDRLAETWGQGYDLADRSQWSRQEHPAYEWPDKHSEPVFAPTYPVKKNIWSRLTDWQQITLPVWVQYRATEPPFAKLVSHLSYNMFTPSDPTWIDYNAFREDVLYLDFLTRWADVFRDAIPRQWVFHANGQDYTAQWHFLHFFRRAELPFEAIGVGSHDHKKNLSDIPAYQRLRKYYKIISSYRPYVLAPGSPAVAVAPSEGEGGKWGEEDEILNYYRMMSMQLVGHGAAFELSYTWQQISNAIVDPKGRASRTKALEWMGEFYRAVDGVKFSLPRQVDILIVRNNNLQRSNRSGLDYGNCHGLIDALGQLNVEFDIAMDQDLVYGEEHRKINLGNYRMIFLPSIDCDYPEDFWTALDAWLSDAEFRGKRALVVGLVGKRTPYLAPKEQFHPVLARWLGIKDYASTIRLQMKNDLFWRPPGRNGKNREITVNFGDRGAGEIGVFGQGRPLLLTGDRKTIATVSYYERNPVFAFGFPLGLAFDTLWGMAASQEPYDLLANIYEDLVQVVEIDRPVQAPHNVRVAASDDKSIILVHERFGIGVTDLCSLELPEGAGYVGCELVPQEDGRTLIRAKLPPYGGLYFKRVE